MLHPNGMIPCLIDHDHGGLAMMEGQAILQYLCRTYDRGEASHSRSKVMKRYRDIANRRLEDAKFYFREDPERSECEQWMGFAQSHLGPVAGEVNLYAMLRPSCTSEI